jgi:hypothetical protein
MFGRCGKNLNLANSKNTSGALLIFVINKILSKMIKFIPFLERVVSFFIPSASPELSRHMLDLLIYSLLIPNLIMPCTNYTKNQLEDHISQSQSLSSTLRPRHLWELEVSLLLQALRCVC